MDILIRSIIYIYIKKNTYDGEPVLIRINLKRKVKVDFSISSDRL